VGTITDWEVENVCESAEDTARRMRETIPQHKQRGDPTRKIAGM